MQHYIKIGGEVNNTQKARVCWLLLLLAAAALFKLRIYLSSLLFQPAIRRRGPRTIASVHHC